MSEPEKIAIVTNQYTIRDRIAECISLQMGWRRAFKHYLGDDLPQLTEAQEKRLEEGLRMAFWEIFDDEFDLLLPGVQNVTQRDTLCECGNRARSSDG